MGSRAAQPRPCWYRGSQHPSPGPLGGKAPGGQSPCCSRDLWVTTSGPQAPLSPPRPLSAASVSLFRVLRDPSGNRWVRSRERPRGSQPGPSLPRSPRNVGDRPPGPGAPARGVGQGAGTLAVRSHPSPAYLVLQPVPPAPQVRVPGRGVPDAALAQAAVEPDHLASLVAHLRHSALLSRLPPTQCARVCDEGHTPSPVPLGTPDCPGSHARQCPAGQAGFGGAGKSPTHPPVPQLPSATVLSRSSSPLATQGCRHPPPVHRAPASAPS